MGAASVLDHIALYYQVSLFCICVPLHAYFLWQLRMHKDHIVIRNRFPKISIAVWIISFVVQVIVIVDITTHREVVSSIGSSIARSLMFIQDGLIFYRVHLIYIRYTVTTQYLETMMKSDSTTDKIAINQPKAYKLQSWLSNIIIAFTITGCIPLSVAYYFPQASMVLVAIPWTLLLLMGIVIVINLICAKVKESLDCIQEIAAVLTVIFVVLLLSGLGRFLDPHHGMLLMIVGGFTSNVIVGTLVLFIPLRLIHKLEQNSNEDRTRTTLSPSNSYTVSTQATTVTPTLTLNKSNSTNKSNSINKSSGITRSNSARIKNMSLCRFLQEHDNFNIFARYLSRCFALESLLFCERALILYHVILKYKAMDTAFVAKEEEVRILPNHKLYQMTFEYLADIYIEMEAMIQKADIKGGSSTDGAMKYKDGLLEVVLLIYKQFCCEDSQTQINVSYEATDELRAWFEDKELKEIQDTFDSYDKLLFVFNAALIETWSVCRGVYSFRFKLEMENTEFD